MTASAEEREARAALSRLTEPGRRNLAQAVAQHGAVLVLEEIRSESDVLGNRSDLADRLRGLDARAELDRAAEQGIRFVIPGDDEWPSAVDGLNDCGQVDGSGGAPLGLWARGPLRLDEVAIQAVAVVGSRSATTYGTTVAGDLSARMAHEGWTVVSGGAFGIDQAAHRGALAEGRTAVVLACGVDRAYPIAHQRLLGFVAEHGVIVSELPPGCTVTRGRFLTRNRVIAALSSGTVVIEAALRSGAINTASWTNELGRPLMAVPGPVTSAASAGAHQLIRNRGAVLVTRGEEVLELLAPMGSRTLDEPRGAESPRDWLDPIEKRVLDALPVRRPAGLASLASTAGLARPRVRRSLAVLEEAGFAEASEDGWRLGPLGRST
ncbi:DNA-processing protein DprA [Nocardioides massiliensis]|uniref:DNA processing protein n=1 Tax=Nocardioides massiliensis TaxID=1325935 RepID=A0ABT9NQ93_9ACTN|nr:DNA-processing protein DprA [Nocardioides massiliensis]MDP9822597.1 DNA processing protein [Nocardioides massiliensis]